MEAASWVGAMLFTQISHPRVHLLSPPAIWIFIVLFNKDIVAFFFYQVIEDGIKHLCFLMFLFTPIAVSIIDIFKQKHLPCQRHCNLVPPNKYLFTYDKFYWHLSLFYLLYNENGSWLLYFYCHFSVLWAPHIKYQLYYIWVAGRNLREGYLGIQNWQIKSKLCSTEHKWVYFFAIWVNCSFNQS